MPAAHTLRFLPALGGNRTLRSELLPDVAVISLAVELGVGQSQHYYILLGNYFYQSEQLNAVVPRTVSRDLRQRNLLIQIRQDHPLQPMSPGQRFLPVMIHPPHKDRADRSQRQACRIDSHTASAPSLFVRGA